MTEVIKNNLGKAVRLLTEQLRQIAIHECQFDLRLLSSLDSRVVELWRGNSGSQVQILAEADFFKLKT